MLSLIHIFGEAEPKDVIRKTEFRTDVIGSNTRLAGAGLEMIELPGRESRLRKALAKVQQDYDFIFKMCIRDRPAAAQVHGVVGCVLQDLGAAGCHHRL